MSGPSSLAPSLPRMRNSWRRIALLALLGMLTVALLVTLSGGRETIAALAKADWRLLVPALLIHYAGFALRGRRWQLLLRLMGHRLRYWPVTSLLLSGWFVSALLPARAGDILRVAVLRTGGTQSDPVPVADGLGSILLERALDILAILLLGATFGWLALRGSLPGWVTATYGVAVLLLVVMGAALLLAPPFMNALRRLWAHRYWQAALDFLLQVVDALRALGGHPGLAASAVILSLLIWLCDAWLLWFCLGALGHWVPFDQAAFVALTVDIVAAIPLTPGGIGQIEVANTALLALVGVLPSVAAAAVLLVRAISYWSFLLASGAVAAASGITALLQPNTQPDRDNPPSSAPADVAEP